METIADRYRRLADLFAAKVAAVPADRWDAPSPCEGWTARDVVRHVAETPGMFLKYVGREMAPLPSVEDDPLAAFEASRSQIQAVLDDPALAATPFEGFFGPSTFEAAIDRFASFDLLVHGWDLARATGLDETISPHDVERLTEQAKGYGDAARAPGVFGAEIPVPDDADPQTKVLAFVGREV